MKKSYLFGETIASSIEEFSKTIDIHNVPEGLIEIEEKDGKKVVTIESYKYLAEQFLIDHTNLSKEEIHGKLHVIVRKELDTLIEDVIIPQSKELHKVVLNEDTDNPAIPAVLLVEGVLKTQGNNVPGLIKFLILKGLQATFQQ